MIIGPRLAVKCCEPIYHICKSFSRELPPSARLQCPRLCFLSGYRARWQWLWLVAAPLVEHVSALPYPPAASTRALSVCEYLAGFLGQRLVWLFGPLPHADVLFHAPLFLELSLRVLTGTFRCCPGLLAPLPFFAAAVLGFLPCCLCHGRLLVVDAGFLWASSVTPHK